MKYSKKILIDVLYYIMKKLFRQINYYNFQESVIFKFLYYKETKKFNLVVF